MMALALGEVDMARDFQKFGKVKVPDEQLDKLKQTIENKKPTQDKA